MIRLLRPAESGRRAEAGETTEWKASAIAADIATLGTGTVVAGLFNVALVFVVPRLISVEDYGYWRLFVLYAVYVGLLHLGFADGALLRWAGRPLAEFRHELWPAMQYLFWQHLAVVLPTCILAAFFLTGPLRFVAIATGLYALIFNQVTLLQFALQSAKVFWPVAVSAVAAPALFLGLVLGWHLKWKSDYREVITFFALGWLVVLVFLSAWAKRPSLAKRRVGTMDLAKQCVLNGWPILMANTAVALSMYADRLAASWAATIQDFAQYSLAGSAMAVPMMAVQASSKVFFSHLAGMTPEGRKQIYGMCARTLLVGWAVLLPYYFLLEAFLRHFLPKYLPSLGYARVLLLGIPFIAVVQILQMSVAYLGGKQRQFLWRTVGVLGLSLGLTSLVAFGFGSLKAVALAQVIVLGSWWLLNEWTMRDLTGVTVGGWARFLAIYAFAGGGYWIATSMTEQAALMATVLYYVGLGALVLLVWKSARRAWLRNVFARETAGD